jgi:rubrerythrin
MLQKYKKYFKESVLTVPTEIDTENATDEQILRASIASELSAINLYQTLADQTSNEFLKKLLLDITKEEKTHIGEFNSLLVELDGEQSDENYRGGVEVRKLRNE